MATYTIEIEDGLFSQLVEAFAANFNFVQELDGDNKPIGKTKIDFMRECTASYWKDVLMSYLRNKAVAQAEKDIKDIEVSMTAR